MKITKSKLRQIINEELGILLREQEEPDFSLGSQRAAVDDSPSLKVSRKDPAWYDPDVLAQMQQARGERTIDKLALEYAKEKAGERALRLDDPAFDPEPYGQTGPGHEKRRADWIEQQMGEFGAEPDYGQDDAQPEPHHKGLAPMGGGIEFGPAGEEIRPSWHSTAREQQPITHQGQTQAWAQRGDVRENPLNFQLAALRKALR